MTASGAQLRVKIDDLMAFCLAALRHVGVNEADARLTAEALVTTDTLGTFTHGTRQLRGLVKNVRDGRLDPKAAESVVNEGPAWAMLDANHAMPPAVACRAMRRAMDKARACGVGYVGVQRTSHFGAAGYYARLAAAEDMLGLAVCNVDPVMTVTGAAAKVMGTNPIAWAAPAGEELMVFLDIATSRVAATKVFAAKALGKSVPDSWLIDAEGRPTTDPSRFPQEGALLPLADYKGYGLALLVEVLGGALPGAALLSGVVSWAIESSERVNQGHAFLAFDIGAMTPIDEFKARMDRIVRELHAAPKAAGVDRIYVPGEMEWERRERALAEGIPLPPDVAAALLGLGEDIGLRPEKFGLSLG